MKLSIVLVVYMRQPLAIDVVKKFIKIKKEMPTLLGRLVIYDNSPVLSSFEHDDCIIYNHDPLNSGTAGAYRFAVESEAEADWLLLLDQDTYLAESQIIEYIERLHDSDARGFAAILPMVYHNKKLVSPCRISSLGCIRPESSINENHIRTGISSGALVNIKLVRKSIENLPKELWLDYVDHWIFLDLHRKKLIVGSIDISIEHDLSIENLSSVSPVRLGSIIRGEAKFCRELSTIASLVFIPRLIVRVLSNSIKHPGYLCKLFRAIKNAK